MKSPRWTRGRASAVEHLQFPPIQSLPRNEAGPHSRASSLPPVVISTKTLSYRIHKTFVQERRSVGIANHVMCALCHDREWEAATKADGSLQVPTFPLVASKSPQWLVGGMATPQKPSLPPPTPIDIPDNNPPSFSFVGLPVPSSVASPDRL